MTTIFSKQFCAACFVNSVVRTEHTTHSLWDHRRKGWAYTSSTNLEIASTTYNRGTVNATNNSNTPRTQVELMKAFGYNSPPRSPHSVGPAAVPARYVPLVLAALVGFVLCYLLLAFRMETSYWPTTRFFKDPSVVLKDAMNSATGTLFEGKQFRTFTEERIFATTTTTVGKKSTLRKQDHRTSPPPAVMCDRWNVVTTIFAPSEAVIRAAKVTGWCTVIVADTKTPLDYMAQAGLVGMESSVHYLSVADQQEWLNKESSTTSTSTTTSTTTQKKGRARTAVGKFLEAIPYKHFARKNIGYLYAIQHGAKIIFDFDDDNLLPTNPETGMVFPPLPDDKILADARMVMTGPTAFNHHPLMGAGVSNSWARGFPLQYIQDSTTQGQIAYEDVTLDLMESVGVMQFCANGNPDIDAIHRLVHPLPMTFARPDGSPPETSPVSTKGSIIVPSHAFAPYNAQATIHTHKAFWGLLLPFTVPGRVSDIWRGYFAEALFRDLGLSVMFLPPAIVQDRNEHYYLADMQAELDLYFKGGKLLEFLSGWDSPEEAIPQRMEELWIDLYERGYIDLNDVKVVQLWLAALVEIGYEFPSMVRRRLDHTVLMGQFNFAVHTDRVLFWHQKWRQWFNRLVVRGPFDSAQISELQLHGIQAYTARDDKGYYSPMENLAATLQDVKGIDGVKGVLYAHDDMLLNVTNLFQNFESETHKLMGTLWRLPSDPEFHAFSIQATGELYWKGEGPLSKTELFDRENGWAHTEKCLDGFSGVRADPRSKTLSVLDKDGSVHVPSHSYSDIMYVPTVLADEFANLAQLMADHKVFLECAVPKIAEILHQTTNVKIDKVSLCTEGYKTGLRGKFEMLETCDNPTSAFHPVKLSLGFSDWNRAFEWATMGKEEFKA